MISKKPEQPYIYLLANKQSVQVPWKSWGKWGQQHEGNKVTYNNDTGSIPLK